MTYGLNTRAFIEDGPVELVARAEAEPLHRELLAGPRANVAGSSSSTGAWLPANDFIDSFPLAL